MLQNHAVSSHSALKAHTNSTHQATPTVTFPPNFLYSLTIISQLEVLDAPSRKICKIRCLRLKTSTGFFLPKLSAEPCCLMLICQARRL